MKAILLLLTVSMSFNLIASTTAEDCKGKISKARSTLLEMMGGKTGADQQALVKDSANEADACVQDMKAPSGKEAKLLDLKKVWGEFKSTREKELVPMILAGKKDEAKALGTGIQRERMEKIKTLLGQLKE